MTDKTPEQTLLDLLALGEKATASAHDGTTPLAAVGQATIDALPAIRSLMEEVEGLREVAARAEGLVEDWAYGVGESEHVVPLRAAISRLGGK